jgi:hypothetical protein
LNCKNTTSQAKKQAFSVFSDSLTKKVTPLPPVNKPNEGGKSGRSGVPFLVRDGFHHSYVNDPFLKTAYFFL